MGQLMDTQDSLKDPCKLSRAMFDFQSTDFFLKQVVVAMLFDTHSHKNMFRV